jgi:alpha-N-arabinofuranosidase
MPFLTKPMVAATLSEEVSDLIVDPHPVFDLSPYLYMQFMEPLGTADCSVEAAWDWNSMNWRKDFIDISRELAPTMMRWGGIFASYYRWREATGPRDKRVPMQNILWGGFESNQIGTAEFIEYCNNIGAEPLFCVNFESEGLKKYMQDFFGRSRYADADEAAEWVDYCNNPLNKERLSQGSPFPKPVKYWQLGNETSYGTGKFDLETAIRKTIEFAQKMRQADPSIRLIGWGDMQRNGDGQPYWAKSMIENAGEHLDYIAFHHMFDPSDDPESPLRGMEYRKDPAKTWDYLMRAYQPHAEKIVRMREETAGTDMPLALTECHFSLKGRNRCEVLSSWAAGVSYARLMNVHERHGDVLKIATLADFCGNIWQVNAIMIPNPMRYGNAFMMPVAKIMSLYREHTGDRSIKVLQTPAYLDITASRTDNTIFLHVVNTSREHPVKTKFSIPGETIVSAKVFEISGDPDFEVYQKEPDPLKPVERKVPKTMKWVFPKASVSAVKIEIAG